MLYYLISKKSIFKLTPINIKLASTETLVVVYSFVVISPSLPSVSTVSTAPTVVAFVVFTLYVVKLVYATPLHSTTH